MIYKYASFGFIKITNKLLTFKGHVYTVSDELSAG